MAFSFFGLAKPPPPLISFCFFRRHFGKEGVERRLSATKLPLFNGSLG
nr:hypothetical protein Iba_chr01bCG8280 [Ipomoea batatas]GMC51425.1 hypothetical protein Iba_chr01cCG6140 [Ipomoea batatas]GMC56706.1 hypothetical protein Iba_chr01fCG9700 [Ipomoea batatas]